MATVDDFKALLPPFVVQNNVLDDLIGGWAATFDITLATIALLDTTGKVGTATGADLDRLIRAESLSRAFDEPDSLFRIRGKNAMQSWAEMGSVSGIEREIAYQTKVTPLIQANAPSFIIGTGSSNSSSLGGGRALGGKLSAILIVWNVTAISETELTDLIATYMPLHVQHGIDYIDASALSSGFATETGTDFSGGGTLTDGTVTDNAIFVDAADTTCIRTSAEIDLGSDFADFTWVTDWVNYITHNLTDSDNRGTSSAVASGSLTDSNEQWVPDEHTGKYLRDSAGAHFHIDSNTSTVLTLTSGTPAAGDYTISNIQVSLGMEFVGTSGTHVGTYTNYNNGATVGGGSINRYVIYQITIDLGDNIGTESDFALKSWSLKGLTAAQAVYL